MGHLVQYEHAQPACRQMTRQGELERRVAFMCMHVHVHDVPLRVTRVPRTERKVHGWHPSVGAPNRLCHSPPAEYVSSRARIFRGHTRVVRVPAAAATLALHQQLVAAARTATRGRIGIGIVT